jgi:type I restriction enzyme S subunit
MTKLATGASYPAVSDRIVLDSHLPLPPLVQQRRIAAILDQADALRAKRRAALAQLDALGESIFVDMFGSAVTILDKWRTVKLGELLSFMTSGSRGWARYYADTGARFLRIQNIGRNELVFDDVARVQAPNTAEARRTAVQEGDVLLSITADLGRTAVVPADLGPAFINQHLAILRTTAITPLFLSAYLASPSGQQQILKKNRQGVKAGLNFDDIQSLVVPVPSTDTQTRFVRVATAVASLVARYRTSLSPLDTLFASLQHRAFHGEL